MRALYQRLREQRRYARILGVGLSVGLLIVACFVFILLESLPSLATLRSRYFSSRLHRPVLTTPPIDLQMPTSETVSGATTPVSPPTPRASAVNRAPTPPPTRSLADYATERFIDRGDRTLSVCENLIDLRSAPPRDVGSFARALQDDMTNSGTNPYAEAALAPLGAILQIPNVASVVTQIRDAQDSGDLSLLRQAQFYSTVAFAAADVYRGKATLDLVSQHAYHLSVLARAAALTQASANATEFQNLCTTIEERVLDPLSASPQDLDEENATLMALLGSLGLTPQQAGFDPMLNTQIRVSISPEKVVLTSPWMQHLFGTGLKLSAR